MLSRSQPNWASDYVLDTKRGIVVSTRNMTELQDKLYKRSFFISARPDLTDVERYQWVIRLDMGNYEIYKGEKLLMAMRHSLQREAMRVHLMYPLASRYERLKVRKITKQSHSMNNISNYNSHTLVDFKDSLIVIGKINQG